ncbi:hypothetical protein SODALDRAFT_291070 [Sodiomyces alkalinus F11]|uniref:Inner centromere protein ARK-binding domain-containing protein n=1 Tax=Sodiomyces alkalinus (strain CBS 110278 / VKM F-3762 / F11) TaxID=1314773 RepID=A0A3N2Q1R9_SODAK|nr:hypothetical protein SODALDRAFT_291070 [Sodiomyces alkalinus F11]ROT40713.1 hypothetical protein SODALDRAFT_291070 [Sodiomyces alkalinus F11]
MAAMRGSRVPVGSATWIADERASALSFAQAEVQEFAFSARNDIDWLNEHMADVFNENQINVAEIFKTPGKLRGKTPRTARKLNNGEVRVPLSDVFSSASKAAPTPFAQQLNRLQSPRPQVSASRTPLAARNASPLKLLQSPRPQPSKHVVLPADSGYYGSQSQEVIDGDISTQPMQTYSPSRLGHGDYNDGILEDEPVVQQSPTVTRTMQSPTRTFQTAREEQTTRAVHGASQEPHSTTPNTSPVRNPLQEIPTYPIMSPQKARPGHDSSPKKSSPLKPILSRPQEEQAPDTAAETQGDDADEARSMSEGSSPIRPVVRKSSLNFASLPAREPLTSKRSLGQRQSRTSYDNRTSYFGRHTGGKSLGNVSLHPESDDDDDFDDAMDIDGKGSAAQDPTITGGFADTHNKAYTQRLQDQISLLGKSQPNAGRQSRSVHSSTASQQPAQGTVLQSAQEGEPSPARSPVRSPIRSPIRSPDKMDVAPRTPGAFPEDDEEGDWIAPPAVPEKDVIRPSPLPTLAKSYSADIMEGVHGMTTVGGAEFVLPKQRQLDTRLPSPQRPQMIPDRATGTPGHGKSASVSVLPSQASVHRVGTESPQKGISVSNPTLASGSGVDRPATPKSPSRVFRDSPLKQVKNKLSSIIKSSRGLLASSAAISAEGKSSILSPSTTRLAQLMNPSTDSISKQSTRPESLYPTLSQRIAPDAQTLASMTSTGSPTRPIAKRTRSSAEREKEEKRKEKEAQKEARLMAEQMGKLEKVRQKEREKARDFSKELEKKAAAQREQEKQEKQAPPIQTPVAKDNRASRMSPRKVKGPGAGPATTHEDADVEMVDVQSSMPPPSVPRSTGPSQATRGREVRRPVKPPVQSAVKSKQAPTVIRVNTGSQHSQFHPSTSALSSNLHDTLGPAQPQQQLKSKASQASLHNKPSLQSLKSSVSSSGRPKALELAAKRKEQEEKEAQRKREAKMEIERKRAAIQEEEKKQELQRRQEAERQKEKERETAAAQAEARKKAAIERAKQTRAPPPAVRSQPNGPPDYASTQQDRAAQRADGPPRPPSRATMTNQRSQEDAGRPVNAVLSHGAKVPPKRPLPQEGSDRSSRNPQARNGPSYQAKDAKRRRTSDDFLDELDMESQPPNIKGPPVRPSGGLKKDVPSKVPFGSGYSTIPSQSSSRDLFKATVTAQHHSAIKATPPVDMSQFSKGAIPFAPNPNGGGGGGPAHKTPARTAGMPPGKSTGKTGTRSSPRFQNGESIELPEIQTDDEDEDEDDAPLGAAAWADSPDLRRALMQQETVDPALIFGPPAPLNMEEVFSKSKDRWHKFRARTSSANWSGPDRLTEEEVQRDLAARDKLRKEGGWSYEMSKDLV